MANNIIAVFTEHPTFFIWVAGFFGLCVGSFLNVVVHRLPMMMRFAWNEQCREFLLDATDGDTEVKHPQTAETAPTLNKPRSRCPSCHTQLRAIDNIPVLSYLILRGKCAHCSHPIGIRYPLVELGTALLSAAVAWRFGFSPAAFAGLILTWMLVALSFIDIDEQLLPDNITLPGVWLGLTVNLFDTFTDITSAVIGAIAGYLVLWTVYQVFKIVTKKEGMGYGDFKLLAMLGAWLGWTMLPLIILLSAVSGAVLALSMQAVKGGSKDTQIPFGPYLAIAGWIAMIWGSVIVSGYLQFAGLST